LEVSSLRRTATTQIIRQFLTNTAWLHIFVHDIVMAGLDPAIHVFLAISKTWMPGTGPRTTW
jgi:hypothetical protein